MLVEDEALSERLERRGERPVGVRRVARLDHVETFSRGGAHDEDERANPAVREFPRVGECAARRRRRIVLPNANALEHLEGRVAGRLRADDRNLKARIAKRTGLEPDPPIEWNRQVLHDDQDSSARLSASPADRLHQAIPSYPGRASAFGAEPTVDVEDVVRSRRDERPNGVRVRGPDDGDARLGECGFGGWHQHLLQVRQVALDIAAVGADQPVRVDDRIVDPKTNPFSDQRLGELHVRALPEVIRLRFKAQPEKRHLAHIGVEDASNGQAEVRLVASQDPGEHRNVDVMDAGEVHERPHVLRQARAAEREPRTEVRSGDVEPFVLAENLHHVAGVDADRAEKSTDLVRERDLQRVEGITGVLQRLGLLDRKRVCRPLEAGEEVGDDGERPLIADAGDDERRLEEVRDSRPLTQELGRHGDAKVVIGPTRAFALEHWPELAVDGARRHRAAIDDCNELLGARQLAADLGAHTLHVFEVHRSVTPGRSAYADHDDVARAEGAGEIRRRAESSRLSTRRDELFETRLDDRATTGLDLVDLLTVDVHADNVVPHFGQACRSHRAYVSESDYCDVHRSPSSGSGESRLSQNGTLSVRVNLHALRKSGFRTDNG